MSAVKEQTLKFICFLVSVIPCATHAHGVGPWGHALDWHNDQIDQVIAYWGLGQKVSVEGKDCLAGGALAFKVGDEFAFDIDETVWLDLEFYLDSAAANLRITYDSNEIGGTVLEILVTGEDAFKPLRLPEDTKGRWYRESISLEHARFANLGFEGSDFSIASEETLASEDLTAPGKFTICGLSLRRTYATPVAKVFGWTAIEVVNENGQPTPVRIGIYDAAGRLPLPSDKAITLRSSLTGATCVVGIGGFSHSLPPWPVENRSVFYTDGRYRTQLPVGEYELIIAKGPEYRLARQRFTVRHNETKSIQIKLQRWTDMAAKGWYSGDAHIHYARITELDDHTLLSFTQAEDLRVANILQIDNSANAYLPHYDWKQIVSDHEVPFVLVPGQEAPRALVT